MEDQHDNDYRWFRANVATILKDHRGSHALIQNCDVKAYFRSSLEAIAAGLEQFGEGNFSVQPVEEGMEDLGFYSHVGSALHA